MLTTLGIRKPDTATTALIKNPSSRYDIQSGEEEWDYCEEDVE